MKLTELYSLRKSFTVIGISGRVGSGCSEIAQKLTDENLVKKINLRLWKLNNNKPDDIKLKICYNYLSFDGNYTPFKVIEYKAVVFLHLLHEAILNTENFNQAIEQIIQIISQNGATGIYKDDFINRFDANDDFSLIISKLKSDIRWYKEIKSLTPNLSHTLKKALGDENICYKFHDFFFNYLHEFAIDFFNLLNKINITRRSRLLHDLANNLRLYGSVRNLKKEKTNTNDDYTVDHIYTVANTINHLIKFYRKNNTQTKIVIDSLKNSLELMFFKEKYSGFYMVSSNRSETKRIEYLRKKFQFKDGDSHLTELLNLDEAEYSGNDFAKGLFAYPDIENCIQKSDYHILKSDTDNSLLDKQLVKLLALLHQPGIVSPTAIERCMQIAFNAKLNSGCISRQVGAVITDENFSVKSVGWNDVAQHQLPCNLRNVKDLIDGNSSEHFSNYEKTGEVKFGIGEKKSFLTLLTSDFSNYNSEKLAGRNCSYCFKTFQNSYEGEKNQVHTRSLHAEENAMLQIVKYGGEGIKGGVLFTTASPCELCSKKAFQLGIKKIYYIDPYPGIARQHILKNAVDKKNNPLLFQFYGAAGRAFHKLYEPFMAYKDELAILSDVKPATPDIVKKEKLKKLLDDKILFGEEGQKKFKQILKDSGDNELEAIKEILRKGLA